MTKNAIKVLVVDDSAFMRKVISDILNSDDSIEVVDTSKNGVEALKKLEMLKPDVVTLDIEMPEMDGITCLKEMLKTRFIPVVMLSSLTRVGAEDTIRALENGAVDFVTKPTNIFEMSGQQKRLEIIEKVKVARNTTQTQRDVSREVKVKPKSTMSTNGEVKCVVAIGTSTGGPRALQDVIPLISGTAPATYLVVQHMPPGFTKSLAERLNSMSEVYVKEAEDKEVLRQGTVYIAPGDYHMLVQKDKNGALAIKLTQTPPVGGHRPAVNVMMESLSDTGLKNIIGVIMTGMGGDGSEGVKKLKHNNKAQIIAQNEETCTVFGMPKVAIQTGAVDVVAPLKEITKEIMKLMEVHI